MVQLPIVLILYYDCFELVRYYLCSLFLSTHGEVLVIHYSLPFVVCCTSLVLQFVKTQFKSSLDETCSQCLPASNLQQDLKMFAKVSSLGSFPLSWFYEPPFTCFIVMHFDNLFCNTYCDSFLQIVGCKSRITEKPFVHLTSNQNVSTTVGNFHNMTAKHYLFQKM